MGNIAKDWPVYILLGAVFFFYGYVIIKGKLQQRKDKEEQNKKAKG